MPSASGQPQVQDDEVGGVAADLVQARRPGHGLADVETGPPQHRGDELTDLVGVLHDEHGLFGHDLSSSPASGGANGRAIRHLYG